MFWLMRVGHVVHGPASSPVAVAQQYVTTTYEDPPNRDAEYRYICTWPGPRAHNW